HWGKGYAAEAALACRDYAFTTLQADRVCSMIRDTHTASQHKKAELAITFADLVYNGQWFTPLREALSAFVDKTQENVTGTVKLKLYKGNIIKAGVWSDYSLYSEEIATFGEDNVYNQADAAGFINLFGLPIKVQAQINAKNKKN
ncbi:MAG: GNAT family N-acetyltransferase, partial [Clostridia bacterium]|nr:GNAT family N-acetyltransferase [Clostridia bacterium]